MHDNTFNAFFSYNDVKLEGAATGPLLGLTFAAKDIFDIAGQVTGGGSPDWLRTHEPAARTAPAVQMLLDAGANMIGKTKLTEFTRGIVGDNAHYGMPVNPRAPGRVPGGSSSGSAAAVAGGSVDFSLGSDTNGSIRVPPVSAGYTVSVGWFTRTPELLARIGAVLMNAEIPDARPSRLVIAEDAFALADESVRDALLQSMHSVTSLVGNVVSEKFCPIELSDLFAVHQVLHGREAWPRFHDWFEQENPRLAFLTARRFLTEAGYTVEDEVKARAVRSKVVQHMSEMLAADTVVCLPSTASPAWPADKSFSDLAESIGRTGMLATIGTALGGPQVSHPLTTVDGLPVGVSLLGARGTDAMLLRFACDIRPAHN